MKNASKFEDVVSFVVLRLFAKKKKGMISEADFDRLAGLGALEALDIVTDKHKTQDLREMVDEEVSKTLELMSRRPCGSCKSTGVRERRKSMIVVCACVDPVRYRGDGILPAGEQYSNAYFEDEFAKGELGRKDLVINIANGVMLFLRA